MLRSFRSVKYECSKLNRAEKIYFRKIFKQIHSPPTLTPESAQIVELYSGREASRGENKAPRDQLAIYKRIMFGKLRTKTSRWAMI